MQARELRKTCHLNLAAVKVKQGKWKEVVSNCSKVLEADGDNIKALYRRAQAYLSTQVRGGFEGSVGEGKVRWGIYLSMQVWVGCGGGPGWVGDVPPRTGVAQHVGVCWKRDWSLVADVAHGW